MSGLGTRLRGHMLEPETRTRLNPEQREAVETLEGPVLILAGAGTGKTRVITHRIARLIKRGVAPDRILGVTFTNKAAREMEGRVTRLLPRRRATGGAEERWARPTLCTFHSLCVRILRRHIERLGYGRNFVIYDEAEQVGVMRRILSRMSGQGAKQDPALVLGWLSRYRNGSVSGGVGAVGELAALAEHVRERYESALRASNAVDFDGLILLVLRLFAAHEEVLEECRARYRYVMVDEYQDTNAAQFELVHALTRDHRNLCVVGDDDQSIYGWRGAELANLLEMERYYPEVKIIRLERNYRSTGTILEAANALIRINTRRRPKELRSQQGRGSRIRLCSFEQEEEEARTLVDEIAAERHLRRLVWSDVAILFRTNQQSRPLETALRQARVPYRLVGGQSFFDRREVRDFLAYLKVLVNPQDDVSLLRIANVPARGLSDATMETLLAQSHEHHCPVFTAMRSPECQGALGTRARDHVARFVRLIDTARARLDGVAKGSLAAWLEHFFDEIGYFGELRRLEKDPESAEQRIRNLKDLMADLVERVPPHPNPLPRGGRGSETPHPNPLPRGGRGSEAVEAGFEIGAASGRVARDEHREGGGGLKWLERFLEEVTLDGERDEEGESAGDKVTLITMHSCKGLEFRQVYIAGLEEGLLPHSRSLEEGSLEEERRLFYVAITRAKESLTLSHCGGRRKYGQLTPAQPSRFLGELPPELIEDGDARGRAPVGVEEGRSWFAGMLDVVDEAPDR
jgi:DNA helicase II / ATP-dependent DNA helicase PcrA